MVIRVIGGLRRTGLTAPMTLNGPMNAAALCCLCRTGVGTDLDPGEIVVMDNLPAHKGPPSGP
jgi:hypothetical protein